MSIRVVQEALDRWFDQGDQVAVATLISVRRSAPLPPGSRFAVSSTGEFVGSISSGCVEGDLHERLLAVLDGQAPETVTYGITDEMAAGVGLSCGGEIAVLLDIHDSTDPAWCRLLTLIETGDPGVLLTGSGSMTRSHRLLLTLKESIGTLGSETLDDLARDRSDDLLGRSDAAVIELLSDEPASTVFDESFVPPPRLVIIGGTPIGQSLCAMASATGFQVIVVDPREAFAHPDRFPDASKVFALWPDDAMREMKLDPRTSVVVLTHDEKLDEPALETALRSRCGYVGLLGGKRTQQQRRQALKIRGVDKDRLDRIHGPVGLNIGARTPEQIAVSILAELISLDRAP